jgi:predicted DCC family thiol-disulfide oxidoreductase YuxK
MEKADIILFDGVCNLCNSSVNFVIRRDRHNRFRFASLQSDIAQQLAARLQFSVAAMESFILISDGKTYFKSTAALKVARELGFPWNLLYAFIIIPRPLRDTVYSWIARNRYRWFGRKDACMVPTPELRKKFLE